MELQTSFIIVWQHSARTSVPNTHKPDGAEAETVGRVSGASRPAVASRTARVKASSVTV